MKVTFVSGLIDMRVIRLAAAAQSCGIDVQLIGRDEHWAKGMLDDKYFSEVHVYSDLGAAWPEVLARMEHFGSELVHCHMQWPYNHLCWWLLRTCKLPIVGDAYDMVNVQYEMDHPRTVNWAPRQRNREKLWLRRVDGICFRSPYLKYLESEGIVPKESCQTILMPEPLLSEVYEAAPDPVVREINHISMMYWNEDHSEDLAELAPYCAGIENLRFHAIVRDKNYPVAPPSYLTMHDLMPKHVYNRFLDLIDAYVIFPSALRPGRCRTDTMCDFFGNRLPEVLERKKLIILPRWRTYIKDLYPEDSLILFDHEESLTREFWESLPARIAEKKQAKADMHPFLEIETGKKLHEFYRNVIHNKK